MPLNDESLNLVDNIIALRFSAVQIMSQVNYQYIHIKFIIYIYILQVHDKVIVDERLNNNQKSYIG